MSTFMVHRMAATQVSEDVAAKRLGFTLCGHAVVAFFILQSFLMNAAYFFHQNK